MDLVWRKSSSSVHILGEMVPDVETEMGERVRAMSFVVEAMEWQHACVGVWWRAERVGMAVKLQ